MNKIVVKFVAADDSVILDPTLTSRQIRVIASTPAPDRAGDIVEPSGCVLTNYLKNPIVLAEHDRTKIVGTFAPKIFTNRIEGIVTFAPQGASSIADETCAMAKAGVLNACSVGFKIIEAKPIGHTGAMHFTKWELMELSLVSVPCNAEAVVIGRSFKSGRVLSGRNAAELSEVRRRLKRSETAHAEATAALEKADKHRDLAMRHVARIAANAGADDDFEDPDDDDADVELAQAASARGTRRVQISERSGSQIYEGEQERYIEFLDAESRKRAIQIAELSLTL